MFSSKLDGIKGLGPKKKEALLKKYLTIDKIKSLSMEEFREVGINETLALAILNRFSEELSDVANLDKKPSLEGKNMFILLSSK